MWGKRKNLLCVTGVGEQRHGKPLLFCVRGDIGKNDVSVPNTSLTRPRVGVIGGIVAREALSDLQMNPQMTSR
ncbi:hypothetical protein KDA_47440 [Dictyobacter alpinus]|uniref:Uncharacterized protein n=1 Tax=Dictyobacter alpinus TaxID=2014873 RepID=A0A402BD65_9CHLR|nr:hypothetical protein KDA_47440 [Dictyobacter alpinus]